jgi:hypothetical protein
MMSGPHRDLVTVVIGTAIVTGQSRRAASLPRSPTMKLAVASPAGSAPDTRFSYESLPAPLAKGMQARAERIHNYGRQTVEIMGKIGHELLQAQAELEHGQFLPWVAALGMSKSAAYRAMDVATNLADDFPGWEVCPSPLSRRSGRVPRPSSCARPYWRRLKPVRRLSRHSPARDQGRPY